MLLESQGKVALVSLQRASQWKWPAEVEPAAHWAQQAAGQPGPSCHPPPSCVGRGQAWHWQVAMLCRAGSEQSAWREGRRQEEGNSPIVIPQITGWDGRGGGGKPTLFT